MFLLISILGVSAFAELPRRSLEMELEEIEGNQGYQVEVTRVLKGGEKKKPVVFKLKSNTWNAKLVPGKYELRVRTVDSRGVPGDWSPAQELSVKLPPSRPLKPQTGEVIRSEEAEKEKVTFSWQPVQGAARYKVQVFNQKGQVVAESTDSGESAALEIPVADAFSWQVTPIAEEEIEGDLFEQAARFEVYGGALESPEFEQIENINTELIKWKKVDQAIKYDYSLEALEADGKWRTIESRNVNKPGRRYQKPLPSGHYRIKVLAQADRRAPSKITIAEFDSMNLGTRNPAAVEQVKSEGSYGSKSNLFGFASYYITMVDYKGVSVDQSPGYETQYPAIGGTGRLGVGTWFGDNSKWGMLTWADMSGFTIKAQTFTYVSGALSGVYRYRAGGWGQLRFAGGLMYRELPVTVGMGDNISTQSKITTVGPVLSANLMRGLTRKLGAQLNLQLYHSTMGMGTPNGKENISDLSYQLGVMGSLAISDQMVGFLGYAYRSEKAGYKVLETPGFTPSQSRNDVTITGHYFNLMLEYGF
ncbi:MAG: hypothetical protein IT289_08500 [Oligoflexia bacterium]|nr:hypothetical protein [Oligoflexia bacterium]